MQAIKVPGGIMHIAESHCVCKHCNRKISFSEIDEKWKDKDTIRLKCTCNKYNNITTDMHGDFISY